MENLPWLLRGGSPVECSGGCHPGWTGTAPCGRGGNEQVELREEVHPQDWVGHIRQQKPMCEPGLSEFDLQSFVTPGTN